MEMEFQTILLYILSGISALLGWFGRELWSAVNKLKEDLKELTKDINDKYVRKDDFKDFKAELLAFMRRVEDKLDNKLDRKDI